MTLFSCNPFKIYLQFYLLLNYKKCVHLTSSKILDNTSIEPCRGCALRRSDLFFVAVVVDDDELWNILHCMSKNKPQKPLLMHGTYRQ